MGQKPDKHRSRYGEGPAYDHRFHAGNIGDVLKHCALLGWLEALKARGPLWICDTHAGAGMHTLAGSGEWTSGIGRLDELGVAEAPLAARRYIDAAARSREPGKGGLYPGSPVFIRASMRPEDRLTLCDMADEPRRKLIRFYTEDAAVEVCGGDGLAALVKTASKAREAVFAGFIDPPFVSKGEWTQVADAVIEVARVYPEASLAVWYPIKSLMRPQVLAAAVCEAGIPAVTLDLITTPLRKRRKTLNGSGLLLVNPPEGMLGPLAEALPWLGDALANPDDMEWTATLRRWRSKPSA